MRTTWSSECRLEWIVSFVAPAERQVRLWRSADRTETGAQRAVRDVLRAVPERPGTSPGRHLHTVGSAPERIAG